LVLFFILFFPGHIAFKKIKAGGGGFTESEGRGLLSEVILGLDHLHTHGFLHRDVKVGGTLAAEVLGFHVHLPACVLSLLSLMHASTFF
jgi:serine/threonine protein kinase